MNRTAIYAGALLAMFTTPAFAFGPAAIAGAQAAAGAVGIGEGGDGGTGVGVGKGGSAKASGGDSSVTNSNGNGDTTSIGAALGQAPSALSPAGICGKDTRIALGVLQWSDYSSKCFNYQIAIVAAQAGNWELANQWVARADEM